MGLCSEVADGGENLEDHPALTISYVRRKAPFQPRKIPHGGVEPFSFRPRQNCCLGHCITRGIGLRRQATIFRLRGAVLFCGHESGPGIWARPRG